MFIVGAHLFLLKKEFFSKTIQILELQLKKEEAEMREYSTTFTIDAPLNFIKCITNSESEVHCLFAGASPQLVSFDVVHSSREFRVRRTIILEGYKNMIVDSALLRLKDDYLVIAFHRVAEQDEQNDDLSGLLYYSLKESKETEKPIFVKGALLGGETLRVGPTTPFVSLSTSQKGDLSVFVPGQPLQIYSLQNQIGSNK